MTSNFDRYQRIASLYDLFDLPFEYGRYRRIRPLPFQKVRTPIEASAHFSQVGTCLPVVSAAIFLGSAPQI
jgi:hypothetical protein